MTEMTEQEIVSNDESVLTVKILFKAIKAFFQSIKFIEILLFGGPVLVVKSWVAFSVKQ